MINQVEEIFHEVADLAEEARLRYFDVHGVDALTRREVGSAVDIRFTFWYHAGKHDIHHVVQRALVHFEVKDLRCGPYYLEIYWDAAVWGASIPPSVSTVKWRSAWP